MCSRRPAGRRTALLVLLDDQVGDDVMRVVGGERRARAGVEPAEVLDRLLDLLERDPGLLLDGRQPVVLKVVEVLGDQVWSTSWQGMSGVSCSSRHSRKSRAPTPGGSSRWTRRKRLLGLLQGARAAEVADHVLQVGVGNSPSRRGCR